MVELGKETEAGRLLRLLGKLSFVTERPELGGDTQWAETGDRRARRGGGAAAARRAGVTSPSLPPCQSTTRTQHHAAPRRYLLKLFRDFVFHQCDEGGAPLLDWGVVAEALNKLDAGVPEKVLLMSRDEMSMLVVSYADLRRCVEGCYAELKARAAPPPPGAAAQPRLRA